MFSFLRARRSVPLEEQLSVLGQCGIRLRPGVPAERLLERFPREDYEKNPYRLLLQVMGSDSELSTDIWYVDAECIDSPDAYVRIAERMRDLAGGDLPLEDIRGDVDIEGVAAWLAFRLNGAEIRWEARIDDNWLDPDIPSHFAQLLRARRSGKRYTYLDLGGQYCLIGCSTAQQMRTLQARTGLDFVWLE